MAMVRVITETAGAVSAAGRCFEAKRLCRASIGLRTVIAHGTSRLGQIESVVAIPSSERFGFIS